MKVHSTFLLKCSVLSICTLIILTIISSIMASSIQTIEHQSKEMQQHIPVIGILTQVLRDYKRFTNERHLHIAASYVKWIESSGAQVLPILLNQNESYYEKVFKQTNGLLLPGGDNLLDPNKNTPMMVAAKKLYKLAVDANDRGDFYPIWGTCLGLELLSVLTSNKNVLVNCKANDMLLKMDFVEGGKLFAPSEYADIPMGVDYSKIVMNMLSKGNMTYNFHHKCITDEGLKEANLEKFYRPLSYSYDKTGIKFIAIFEAYDYPFYGVQFHPEKAPFEFAIKKSQQNLPHSRQAIAMSRYFADFFVAQAQLNNHRSCPKELQPILIYSHKPVYTAPKNDMYEQRYFFPFNKPMNELSTEEFIDHVPNDNEEANEEVNVSASKGPGVSACLDINKSG